MQKIQNAYQTKIYLN